MSKENKLNFVFWGTPDVASETLEILKRSGYMPSLIVTSPDKPQGRKMLITPPSVKVWAEKNNIPFIQPDKLNEEIYDVLRALSQADEPRRAIPQQRDMRGKENIIDFFLVVAYGKIMPENILNMPRLGSINIHYSLLPKYRGASPVETAILNGDTETGITIQQMEFEMDAGGILAQEKIEIFPDEKAGELRTRLIKVGGELLVKTLPKLSELKPAPQNKDEVTFTKKIKKEDGLIDLSADGVMNYNKFRAYATWPRTYFFKPARNASHSDAGGDGKRIIITSATLENGKFTIKKVIPEGGKEIDYKN